MEFIFREKIDFIESAKNRKVVIYDTGNISQVINAIKSEVVIEYIVDDNFLKWNTDLLGYKVMSPQTLKGTNHVVLITSPYYAYRVENHLKCLGVNHYFCYGFFYENLKKSFKVGYGTKFVPGRAYIYPSRDTMRMVVGLTNKCNLRCPFCIIRNQLDYQIPDVPINKFIRFLESAKNLYINGRYLSTIELSGNREFFMYRWYERAITEVYKHGFGIQLVTNGVKLFKKDSEMLLKNGLEEIVISVCGISPDVYVSHQGYNKQEYPIEFAREQLNVVVDNVRQLVRLKREIGSQAVIAISYLIDDQSIGEIKKAIEFWKDIGVDFFWGNSVAEVDNEGSIIKNRTHNNTASPREYCYNLAVCANGNVNPCCGGVSHAELIVLGNIFDTPISEIINSKKFNDFYENLASGDPALMNPICLTCPASRG